VSTEGVQERFIWEEYNFENMQQDGKFEKIEEQKKKQGDQ
jgi:hypothetical protein